MDPFSVSACMYLYAQFGDKFVGTEDIFANALPTADENTGVDTYELSLEEKEFLSKGFQPVMLKVAVSSLSSSTRPNLTMKCRH